MTDFAFNIKGKVGAARVQAQARAPKVALKSHRFAYMVMRAHYNLLVAGGFWLSGWGHPYSTCSGN